MNPHDVQPEPVRRPVMFQSWCRLTFLHWRYPADQLQRQLPRGVRVESFDGTAWVGITPFPLRGLRPVLFPPVPWISEFPETNCRTYVTGPDGHSGIWFFSLDAARVLAVIGARLGYGLPYAWSRMRVAIAGRQMIYESTRRWPAPHARTRIVVEPGEPVIPEPIDVFLTARFRLYTNHHGKLMRAKVEHAPWPLQRARIVEVHQTLTDAAGLGHPATTPLVHYSPGVDVRIGLPEAVDCDTQQ